MITKTGNALTKFVPKMLSGAWNTLSNAGSGIWNIGKAVPQAFSNAGTTNMIGKDLGKNIFSRGLANMNSAKNTLKNSVTGDQASALRTMRNYGAYGTGGYYLGKKILAPAYEADQQQLQ